MEEDAIADPFEAFQQESRVQTSLYFQRKYLITFFKDKVLFVHVARAYQCILYERFRKTMLQGRSLSQSLLFPLEFEYTPSEILALQPMLSELQSAGRPVMPSVWKASDSADLGELAEMIASETFARIV